MFSLDIVRASKGFDRVSPYYHSEKTISTYMVRARHGQFISDTVLILYRNDSTTPMTHEEFESSAQAGFLLIPEKFREQIRNVAILIEDEPSEEVRRQEGLSEGETLLGLYQGIPNIARGDSYGIGPTVPDTITLFKVPIEEVADGIPEEVQRVVAETIWHEFAHYFGMDEDEVRSREEEHDRQRRS